MSSKEVKDFSIIITSFHLKFVGFWIANNHAERLWMNFALFYTFFAILLALSTEMRDLYYTWGDFGETIYIMCNVVTIILVLTKIFVLLIYYDELHDVIHYAKRNFWHTDYDSYEQMIMDRCKRTCITFVCIFSFFAEGTVTTYIIRPLMENHGKNESERILPFNMRLPDYRTSFTPYFEMLFLLQVVCGYLVGVCYHCFDNMLCILNLHTAAQFRILQHRFANMCNTIDHEKFHEHSEKSYVVYSACKYEKFKAHVQQHQALIEFCRKLEEVFNLLVFGQVSLFSLLICLDGYLILMDILYVITNLLTVVMSLLKICIILMHKSEFLNLIIYMQQNFWNVDYDFREKEILNNCKRTCAFFVSSVTSIGICAMLSYVITPILVYDGPCTNAIEHKMP
ncbi:odorant receptor 13a-like [Frieseomelitta varia]|uniref:odorant receptor 13a-like n=1 Tax=Frieseomelitta varia TaxID=561572 RepID=UPI001CB6AEDC|nr:odorant receptor 13a-like [Frieseomelitta varia]